ncbi:hypothetical protein ABZS66_31445 [Dactylosporangium sp. NPDC005572]|uniref:hypothetical protein n=1 Tax=Dactylosporangium sp. NPDC005572 TaxID=3156889 RepID=UPI0033A0A3ED
MNPAWSVVDVRLRLRRRHRLARILRTARRQYAENTEDIPWPDWPWRRLAGPSLRREAVLTAAVTHTGWRHAAVLGTTVATAAALVAVGLLGLPRWLPQPYDRADVLWCGALTLAFLAPLLLLTTTNLRPSVQVVTIVFFSAAELAAGTVGPGPQITNAALYAALAAGLSHLAATLILVRVHRRLTLRGFDGPAGRLRTGQLTVTHLSWLLASLVAATPTWRRRPVRRRLRALCRRYARDLHRAMPAVAAVDGDERAAARKRAACIGTVLHQAHARLGTARTRADYVDLCVDLRRHMLAVARGDWTELEAAGAAVPKRSGWRSPATFARPAALLLTAVALPFTARYTDNPLMVPVLTLVVAAVFALPGRNAETRDQISGALRDLQGTR